MRAAAVGALLLAAGCLPMTSDAPPSLEGPVWVLTELGGAPFEARAFLRFGPGEDGAPRVTGEAPCNLVSGRWQGAAEGGPTALGPLIATRRFCDRMADEDAFLRALSGVESAQVADGRLTLTGSGDALVFTAAEAPPAQD